MKETILVTGGAGYIGGVATEIFHKEGYKVIILDNLSNGNLDSIPQEIPFYKGNVGDTELLKKIFSSHKIDVVCHFAGVALVGESMKNPYKYFDTNFCQALNLLDLMILFNVKKIVFSSTCAVYGTPKTEEIPIKEDTVTKPINPYGESKLIFENALKSYKNTHSLDYICLRYFNVAGATKLRGEKHNPETHLIPLVIRAANDKDYTLEVYGGDYPTKDGTAIRDYTHVVDLIYAHINAIEALLSLKKHSTIYNVGYGHGYSVLEIVNAAKNVLQKDIKYKIAKRREGDPPVLIADSSKVKAHLNWVPKYDSLEEIISTCSCFIN